jgi:predicted MFS family arabinose efflux permease
MVDLLRRRRVAIAAFFFVTGALLGSWASRIPAVKDHAGLSDGQLGVALLAIGAGTVVSLPLTSVLLARFGSAAVVGASAVAGCAALSAVAVGTSFVALAATLACFGAAVGASRYHQASDAVILGRAWLGQV